MLKIINTLPRSWTKKRSAAVAGTDPSAAEPANPETICDARRGLKSCVFEAQTFVAMSIGSETKNTGLFPMTLISGTQNIFPTPRSRSVKHTKYPTSTFPFLNSLLSGTTAMVNLEPLTFAKKVKKQTMRYVEYFCRLGQFCTSSSMLYILIQSTTYQWIDWVQ
jgi:hypothetical protein